MPLSLDQFVQQLTGSGLLTADEVSLFRKQLPHGDAEQLARELVRQRRLTAFQAQQVYAGKAKTLVLGNYVVLDKLGQGGMGMVLKAQHRRMNRIVALKVLSPSITKTKEVVARFHREVQAAARLEHPNIVSAYDADEANGTHFFVMQYIDGQDLSSLVKSKGTLAVDQAIGCVLQAAKGLQFAHAQGVIHRDIKPANLLLDDHGVIKILDMGLARIEGDTGAQAEITNTGAVMGTVDYMAPEQARNTKSADARSDIYSLGITLWYLLVGKAAYDGQTLTERLLAHQTDPIPSLCAARPDAPAGVDAVFQKMVAKRPSDRYQSLTDVIAALESCQRGEAPAVAPTLVAEASEDSQFNAFLSGLARTEAGIRTSNTAAAPAARVTTDALPTMSNSRPESTTNPQVSGQRRPRAKMQNAPIKRAAWQDLRVQVGTTLCVVFLIWYMLPRTTPSPSLPHDQNEVINVAKTDGAGDYALEFDGIDDIVSIPDLQFTDGALTLEAWIQPGPLASGVYLGMFANSHGAGLWGSSGLNGFTINNSDGNFGVKQAEPLGHGAWVHTAGVLQNGEARYYVNGKLIGRSGKISTTELYKLEGGYLGSQPENYWRGRMRSARFSRIARYHGDFMPGDRWEADADTLALYDFRDGSGDVLRDSSSNKRVGQISGAAWVKVAKPSNSPAPSTTVISSSDFALQFDGIDDYVNLTTLSGFISGPRTVEAYVIPSRDGSDIIDRYQRIVSLGGGNDTELQQNQLNWTAAFNQSENNYSQTSAGNAVAVGQRVHLAAVFDGQEAALYIDGVRSKRRPQRSEKSQGTTSGLIGASGLTQNGSIIRTFAGVIDEVRISRIARYAQNFQPAQRFDTDPDTVALYHFDEGAGETLKDSSGREHHGQIVGAKWVRADGSVVTGVAPPATASSSWPFDPPDGRAYVWSTPENLGPDTNTRFNETVYGISGDGLMMTWVRNEVLLMSRRGSHDEPFLSPFFTHRDLKFGMSGTCTADGQVVVTDQNTGQQEELWIGTRLNLSDKFDWQRMPAPVNADGNTIHPVLSSDGLTLVATSTRKAGWGDLWMFTRGDRNQPFGSATRLPTPVNTANWDMPGFVSNDRRTLIASEQKDKVRIFRLFTRGTVDVPFGPGTEIDIPLGDVTRTMLNGGYRLSPDGRTLYFHSPHIPNGYGQHDIWMTRRVPALSSPSVTAAPPPAQAPFESAQAKQHQEAWAKHLGVPTEYTNSLGMKFRLIPPGEFQQGSPPSEIEAAVKATGRDQAWKLRIQGEGPQHKVRLTQPYYLGIHEVTQRQYEQIVGHNPAHYAKSGRGSAAVEGLDTTRHPVESVSWGDVELFCRSLSEREKLRPSRFDQPEHVVPASTGYRLPTETEWEFACRAGTATRFFNGDQDSDVVKVAWTKDNSKGRTHPVGWWDPNPFGLYDLHGNVWEWTLDCWDINAYRARTAATTVDPQGAARSGSERVVRGGDQQDEPGACRSAHRGAQQMTTADPRVGFRLVLPVESVKQLAAR